MAKKNPRLASIHPHYDELRHKVKKDFQLPSMTQADLFITKIVSPYLDKEARDYKRKIFDLK